MASFQITRDPWKEFPSIRNLIICYQLTWKKKQPRKDSSHSSIPDIFQSFVVPASTHLIWRWHKIKNKQKCEEMQKCGGFL